MLNATTFRSIVKPPLERFLANGGPAWIARTLRSQGAVILAYHNVVPEPVAKAVDPSLHLPRGRFVQHLDSLLRDYDPVPLDALLDSSSPGRRPRICFTFDDAYRGAVTVGVNELARLGVPATFFVAPALVGGESFWWDAIFEPSVGMLTPDLRHRAVHELRGDDMAVRRWARGSGLGEAAVPESMRPATTEDLRSAADVSGIALASHSWSHRNLTRLSGDELREELTKPRKWLSRHVADPSSWLAYPYGLSSATVEEIAATTGHSAALGLTTGRRGAEDFNRYRLPRLNVPAGLSAPGLAVKAAFRLESGLV